MKNLKKILALLLCFVLVLSLTACGTGTVSTVSSTGTLVVTEGKVDPSAADYANDIDGLVSYMKDCEVITGEATDMSADFIGAVKGKQFCFTYGDATITAEFYEYDLDNMSEKATSCLEGVKTAQKLVILGKTIEEIQTITKDNAYRFYKIKAAHQKTAFFSFVKSISSV